MNLGDACINTRIMRVALKALCIEVNASLKPYPLPSSNTSKLAFDLTSIALHV